MSALLETVRVLKERAEAARQVVRKSNVAIAALQSTCEHDWKETGYDPSGSTTTYYACALCEAEMWE